MHILEHLNGLGSWLCPLADSSSSTYLFELLYHSVLPFTSRVLKEEGTLTASLYYTAFELLQPGSQPHHSLRLFQGCQLPNG